MDNLVYKVVLFCGSDFLYFQGQKVAQDLFDTYNKIAPEKKNQNAHLINF